jgi:hypothetical protein
MTGDPQHQQHLPLLREDEAVADQFQGALETLFESVKDDPVVLASLPACVKFRDLVKQLLKALSPSAAADPAGLEQTNIQALIAKWQAARTEFHANHRRNKDYLEKLALRIYR